MTYRHGIVWLDHYRAIIITFSDIAHAEVEIESTVEGAQLHRKSGKPGSGHLPDDHDFFRRIAVQIEAVPEVLITGPGTAKVSFERFLRDRFPDVVDRIHGVEALDHPTEGELLAYGRKRFKRIDQLLGDA